MYLDIIKSYIQNIATNKDINSTGEHKLSLHLPTDVALLNSIFSDLIIRTESLKDFKVIEFSNLNNNAFTVQIQHKHINKTLRCKIRDVGYNDYGEILIIIDFVEGLGFFEKIAIQSALAFQKGWYNIKDQFQGSEKSKSSIGNSIEFSSKGLIVNVTQAMIKQNFDFLIPYIKIKDVSTDKNKIIIDLELHL